ncbi:hypothetical protein AA14337_1601 [Acetobacter malorum DSM 14337]|uniref:Uncharacterized protein n=1 Tax=Acetobacter malorum DSM 14337 TaxID=1307910 RepID=A0ABQ0PUE1_9PROT|nr:hypothetical protein AA14337_1601 [Acetobacter malorum DSM 14337]
MPPKDISINPTADWMHRRRMNVPAINSLLNGAILIKISGIKRDAQNSMLMLHDGSLMSGN